MNHRDERDIFKNIRQSRPTSKRQGITNNKIDREVFVDIVSVSFGQISRGIFI